jgi:hypothetical protein
VTETVKVVVRVTPPPLPVTVMVEVPVGVLAAVVKVRVLEQVAWQLAGAKAAVMPDGIPDAENETVVAGPATREAVIELVTLPPLATDLFPPVVRLKSEDGTTPPSTPTAISD